MAHSGNGRILADLLIKAAGLSGKRVKSITCRCTTKEVITFEAELLGVDEDISTALKDIDVTAVTDPMQDYETA